MGAPNYDPLMKNPRGGTQVLQPWNDFEKPSSRTAGARSVTNLNSQHALRILRFDYCVSRSLSVCTIPDDNEAILLENNMGIPVQKHRFFIRYSGWRPM